MNNIVLAALAGALLACAAPVCAQAPAGAAAPAAVPIPSDVATAYATYHLGPIWFRAGAGTAAVQKLEEILKARTVRWLRGRSTACKCRRGCGGPSAKRSGGFLHK